MTIRFPVPLERGDRIGVTSPSSGVDPSLRPRLDFAVKRLRDHGYEVVIGDCMDGSRHVSAPASERAQELASFLLDPDIRAVIPPWGGETAIDLVPILDWDAIGAAAPTWFVGFSDISTLHGNNLMDFPYDVPAPLLSWLSVATTPTGGSFRQASPGVHRARARDDWTVHPDTTTYAYNGSGTWTRLDGHGGDVDVTGRLIGGCIETLCNLAGTRFADIPKFLDEHAPEGLIVYVEAAEADAATVCRHLHGMRLAGFFSGARAIMLGRTAADDHPHLTQHDAVLDALNSLEVPIIADVECGHVPPYLPIVNGALGRLQYSDNMGSLEQTLA